jgi:hypothetical protein
MSDAFELIRREFFPECQAYTLKFNILSDDWQALRALFAENGGTDDDGLRFTQAAGRAYIEGHVRLLTMPIPATDPSSASQAPADEVNRLQLERMGVESRYVMMKYRAYSFMQAAKTLEMKLNACRSELESLRRAYEQLRARPGSP